MAEENQYDRGPEEPVSGRVNPTLREYFVHGFLFLATFAATTLAGVQWLNRNSLELSNFSYGLTYGCLILMMLGSHEFGHYFAARYHKVRTTLPFFIPLPPFLPFGVFGTLGAVIRIRSAIASRKVLFDIGAAGPIAGFVVSLAILIIGFVTLPSREYLHLIHPEYAQMAVIPEGGIRFGETLLFLAVAELFAPAGSFVPPMNEIYHYPFLCVGWFGLFVTALNLIPIGQLDGGHISFAMFGERSESIALSALAILTFLGLGGLPSLWGLQPWYGWLGWLVFAAIHVVVVFGFRMSHPQLHDQTPLDPGRRLLGWFCYGIFISSISIAPFTISDVNLLF